MSRCPRPATLPLGAAVLLLAASARAQEPSPPPDPAAARPSTQEELERRVAELEQDVAQLRARGDGATPPQPAKREDRWSFGGYGELLLSSRFFHPDPKKSSTSYRQTDIDLARLSFFVNSTICDWLTFASEIEFEHGGTGVSREIEWDEFGEYETEVEKGGEVSLEQAYLEARLPAGFRLRAGHLLVPIGLTTSYHLPTMFSGTRRPESESHLIPLVWHETGAELSYRAADAAVRVQLVSGLDSTEFSSDGWVAGGSQQMFETSLFNDVGVVLAAEYTGISGTLVGVGGYTSGTTHNRPKREIDNIDARVLIGDVHVRGQYGPLRVRGLALGGSLSHADAITAANASLSTALGAPRTPVGSAAYAFFVESALDVLNLVHVDTGHQVDLFVRAETYDSMWKAPKDLDNPLMQRRVLTAGVNYLPHPRVVLKAEYVSRWINQDHAWRIHQDEVNAALGFVL